MKVHTQRRNLARGRSVSMSLRGCVSTVRQVALFGVGGGHPRSVLWTPARSCPPTTRFRTTWVLQATARADDQREFQQLEQLVKQYDEAYYNQGISTVSDDEYDAIKKKLAAVRAKLQGEAPSSLLVGQTPLPTPVSALQKVQHPLRMLSLASVNSQEAVEEWRVKLGGRLTEVQARINPSWVLEPKVDGLAIRVLYERGRLKQAATRGDGMVGEDVTHNARFLQGLPTVIRPLEGEAALPERLEVRGEVYMTKQDFETVKQERPDLGLATARNAAAGSLRLLDPAESRRRRLSFIGYQLLLPPGPGDAAAAAAGNGVPASRHLTSSQLEALEWLRAHGFAVNPDNQLHKTFTAAVAAAGKWMQSRDNLGYEVDGAVLKVNEVELQDKLGITGNDPRWAVAWKFEAESGVTRLLDISLSVGRTGQVVPIAELEEVELQGTKVRRASLHNVGQVKAMDLRLGDSVLVKRCGDVIPQVTQSLKELRDGSEKPWEPPTCCPSCGGPLHTRQGEAEVLFCPNTACPAQGQRQVEHYAKFCIPGLGGSLVEQVMSSNLVQGAADLYKLTADELLTLPRWGERKAANLLASIEASKHLPMAVILEGLGIRHIGKGGAEALAKAYGSIDDLAKDAMNGDVHIAEVGTVTRQFLQDWFTDPINVELLDELRSIGVEAIAGRPAGAAAPGGSAQAQDVAGSGHGPAAGVARPQTLTGMNVVVTGTLVEHGLTRNQFKQMVEEAGGTLQDGIKSSTSMLVVGEDAGGRKPAEAAKKGIPVFSEAEFFDKYMAEPLEAPGPAAAPAAPPSPSATAAGPVSTAAPAAPPTSTPARRSTQEMPTSAAAAILPVPASNPSPLPNRARSTTKVLPNPASTPAAPPKRKRSTAIAPPSPASAQVPLPEPNEATTETPGPAVPTTTTTTSTSAAPKRTRSTTKIAPGPPTSVQPSALKPTSPTTGTADPDTLSVPNPPCAPTPKATRSRRQTVDAPALPASTPTPASTSSPAPTRSRSVTRVSKAGPAGSPAATQAPQPSVPPPAGDPLAADMADGPAPTPAATPVKRRTTRRATKGMPLPSDQ